MNITRFLLAKASAFINEAQPDYQPVAADDAAPLLNRDVRQQRDRIRKNQYGLASLSHRS